MMVTVQESHGLLADDEEKSVEEFPDFEKHVDIVDHMHVAVFVNHSRTDEFMGV